MTGEPEADDGASPAPVGPPNALAVPRYAGPDTFARLPRLSDVGSAAVAIAGIPFDSGVSYRPGARFGPASVRAGSKLLRPYHPGLDVEPWTGHQVADAGDLAANPFDLRQAISEVEAGARGLLEAADYLIAIGGDHTIALPLLRATAARHGPVALVHFDAHLDTWDTYFGAPYTHGTPFRRAVEEGILALDCSAHVGIRGSLYTGSDLTDDRKLGFATVSTTDVARRGVDDAIDRVRERVGDRPVYVSVDIDVLDPAHAPGTGTPEPGGLTTRELQLILRGLDGLRLAGADIVEVAPAYDHAELTSLAAANVAYELLGLFALHRARRARRRAGPGPARAPAAPTARNGMHLQRLKDKLGNRSNASAEVEYDGAVAWLVGEEGRGVRTIIEMVNMTRLDCVLGAATSMRSGAVQAAHHAAHRSAFGALLAGQPLMANVLAVRRGRPGGRRCARHPGRRVPPS